MKLLHQEKGVQSAQVQHSSVDPLCAVMLCIGCHASQNTIVTFSFINMHETVYLSTLNGILWGMHTPRQVQDRTARLQNFARQRGVNGSRWSRDGQARWMLNAVRNQARKRVLMRPSVKETGQQNILVVGIKMGDQVGRLPAMKHNLPLHEVLQPR